MAPSRRVQARDLYSLPIVGWCAPSPTRKAVAYVVTRLDEEANVYRGSIRVVPILHKGAASQPPASGRALTDGSARDQAPQWSPDGKMIFFLSDRSGSAQVWHVDASGGEATALPTLPGSVSEFAVSPDGALIAAVTVPTSRKEEIERRGWRRITRLRYRSDGPGYLDDKPEIWIVDLRSNTTKRVTDGSGFVAGVTWNPAGMALAYCGDHEADADSLWRRELWTAAAADDFTPRKVLTFATALEAPSWSPDGARIAFCGIEEAHGAGGKRNLRVFVVDRDGANHACWTQDEEWTCGNFILTDVGAAGSLTPPAWISDEQLAVLGSSRGAARVFRVSLGASAAALTSATMSATHFAALGDDTIVHCSSDQATPPELYLSRAGQGIVRLTAESAQWSSSRSLPPATHFTVASEGCEIDTWHLAGLGDGKRPCVLYIHGGPHFAYGYAYVFNFVLLAAAGYDIVYCNPRGSQSYGEAFAKAIAGDWAQPAFNDCAAALDAVIARFPIDPNRLGVAGGSYGGYLTVWTVAHTSRFAAAIALRPATSLQSLWGTSEVGRMLAEDFGGSPYDVPDVYAHDSPLTYANAIKTPLLIIFGDQDYRTPAEQSEQLLTALLKRGAVVEGLHFLRTDHNLSRGGPPWQRIAHEEAIVAWFDRFLAG